MPEFRISSLRFNYVGNWVPATDYSRDAVITYQGTTYVCQVPHTSTNSFRLDLESTAPINGFSFTYWVLLLRGHLWQNTWQSSFEYFVNNIVYYNGTLYECTVSHLSTGTFNDDNFEIYATLANYKAEWMPTNTYGFGDVVKYGGIVYSCLTGHTAATYVSPTYLGLETNLGNWEVLVKGVEYLGDWQANYRYKLNDIVKLNSNLYTCVQYHTSTADFSTVNFDIFFPGQEYSNTWTNTVTYQLGDTVMYGGYTYTSITENNIGNVPSVDEINWELLQANFTVRGEFVLAPIDEYKIGAVVNYGGNVFVAIKDVPTNEIPTSSSISTSYIAAGSSVTTLKISNTTNIKLGMFVSGAGFNRGQTVVSVTDLNTIIINEVPDSPLVNGQNITFTGINYQYWSLLTPGTAWTGRWNPITSYVVGDLVTRINATYRCIDDNIGVYPETDIVNNYWVIYALHSRNNAMNAPGDLLTYTNGKTAALPIGTNNYLLKVTDGQLSYQNMMVTPNVFYVATNGFDSPDFGWGLTLDRPWKTIAYACSTLSTGILNQNTADILRANKTWLTTEVINFMVYSITNNLNGYTSSYTLDQALVTINVNYIIDAVIYDISRGGNSQSVATALSYFQEGSTSTFYSPAVAANVPFYIPAFTTLQLLFNSAINLTPPAQNYQELNSVLLQNRVAQQLGFDAADAGSQDLVDGLISVIITSLTDANTLKLPSRNTGLTATVFVKTGTYLETLPISVPENVAINGDELRGVVIQPATSVKTLVTNSSAASKTFTCVSTVGMVAGMPLQFTGTAFGGIYLNTTYYVIGTTLTTTAFQVSASPSTAAINLIDATGSMTALAGDSIKDMFRMRNGSGLRNVTLNGLEGALTELNEYSTRRPTGGAYVTLDPGFGPTDTSAWIFRKSPYIQNVTTFGNGCTGLKIDGSLHNGGNKSIVCNDFTQILSDGIGIWVTDSALCEAVSVFSYYAYTGYFAESGGRIRATNGNSSYGVYGCVAEGYDVNEIVGVGEIYNRFNQAQASTLNAFGNTSYISRIQYTNAGSEYNTVTTNLLSNSNNFISNWTTDGNVALAKNKISPFDTSDAWTFSGTSSASDTGYLYQTASITPPGGTYINVSALNITGGGIGATFNVVITSTGYSVTKNATGSGYVIGNQLKILGSVFGGINVVNDLVITLTSLTGSSVNNFTTVGAIPAGADKNYTLSVYAKKNTSSSFDLYAFFLGTSTKASYVNYNFDTNTITPGSSDGAGMLPVHYGSQFINNGWYRVWFSVSDVTSANTSLQFRIYSKPRNGAAGSTSFYGAQLEASTSLYAPNFYLESELNKYSAYATYKIVGPGSGVVVVGNETRSLSIFQTKVSLTELGSGYVTASNQAQNGSSSYITIAQTDVNSATAFQNMRVFVNSGAGVGQYGIVAYYIPFTKQAFVIKESYDLATVTATLAASNEIALASTVDITQIYTGQPIRFVPTYFRKEVTATSEHTVLATASTGGTTNTITVADARPLYVTQPIRFSGPTFGGVITNFTYYIVSITGNNIKISTVESGEVLLLNTEAGSMTINYPSANGYITTNSSTATMAVNLPITFTGNIFGGVVLGAVYYINDIIDNSKFTISNTQVIVTATETSAINNQITVDAATTLIPTNPIVLTSTIGNLTINTPYYISNIIDPLHVTVSNTLFKTIATATELISNLITVESTAGFIAGNPISFAGRAIGGLISDRTYYILNINNSTSLTISNTYSQVVILVTGTIISTDPTRPNQLITSDTGGLEPLNSIRFVGVGFAGLLTDTTYYISRVIDAGHFTISNNRISTLATATQEITNLITVTSTTGFVANNPITFTGVSFGGITTSIRYFILAVNNATSITVSTTPGGSAVSLTTASGIFTVKTTAIDFVLTDTTAGSLTGFTVANGAEVPVSTDLGYMVARTTGTNSTLTTETASVVLTSTSAKRLVNSDYGLMNAQFSTPTFGGIIPSAEYYILAINTGTPNKISITDTQGGITPVVLSNATGNMQFGTVGWDHVNPGTPAVPLDSTSTYFIEPRVVYNEPEFTQGVVVLPNTTAGTQYNNIAYGNDLFIAIANGGYIIARSADGVLWSSYTLPTSSVVSWSDIAYGNNYWVMIGNGSSVCLYSNSNGLSWKESIMPSVTSWTNATYGNGIFVAIAQGTSSSAYSTDNGQTWYSGNGLTNVPWVGVAYGAGIFVAVASGTTVASRSTDGITWTTITLPVSSTWSSITYGGGKFVIVSSTSATPLYSFNGITWYRSPYSIIATSVTYGQGVFVTVNNAGITSYSSEDALSWIPHTVTNDTYGAVAFGYATPSNIGVFVTVSKFTTGSNIFAGCRTKARATVANGYITGLVEWEPGSNYTSIPAVTLIDPNATTYPVLSPRIGNGALANPTFINPGTGYINNSVSVIIWGSGFADEIPSELTVVAENISKQPVIGSNLVIGGDPTNYKITSVTNLYGTTVPNLLAQLTISPSLNTQPTTGTSVSIRANYSQVRLTGHDFLYIGSGNKIDTDYPTVDANNASLQNQVLENNTGRVFYTSTDQDGNFTVGSLFGVQQATGIVTISASQFGLTGLETLSLGGIAVGASSVVVSQFSTDSAFIANADTIVPTQKAIKSYLGGRLSQGGSNGFTGNITAGSISIGNPNVILNTIPDGIIGSSILMKRKVAFEGNGGYGQIDGSMMAYDFFIKNGAFRSSF